MIMIFPAGKAIACFLFFSLFFRILDKEVQKWMSMFKHRMLLDERNVCECISPSPIVLPADESLQQ